MSIVYTIIAFIVAIALMLFFDFMIKFFFWLYQKKVQKEAEKYMNSCKEEQNDDEP